MEIARKAELIGYALFRLWLLPIAILISTLNHDAKDYRKKQQLTCFLMRVLAQVVELEQARGSQPTDEFS
jgi:HD-like signal output (HDOD) protein